MQFKVGIERELAQGLIAGADFTYINTTQSTFQRDVNLGTATEDATGRPVFARSRPNPDFFIMQMTDSSARSLYRALTYTLNLRRSSFALDAAYTLSWKHSHDDIEQDYSIISYDNVNDLSNEYNYSLTDQRHQLVAYGSYYLPWSFDVAAAARLSSARPFDVMTAFDYNRDEMLNDRPIINGQVMPRNAFRGRPFYDVTVRLQKHFALPNERGRITASVDFFNLFGFDNVQVDHMNMMYGPGTAMVDGTPVSGGTGPGRWYDPVTRKTYEGGTLVNVHPPANFNQLRDEDGEYYRNNIPGDPFQVQVGLRFQF